VLNSAKKILIVVESIDTEDSSGSKANVAFIKSLKEGGFNIKVYHYTRKDIDLKGISCVSMKENRKSVLFLLSRIERYCRYFLKVNLNKHLEKVFGFSFTLFNDRNSIISSLNNIKSFKPDLVITLSKGGSFRPHHALLKMPEWHCIWLAYIHDPYPAHLYPRPFAWVESGYLKKWQFVRDVSEKAAFSGFPSQLLMEWMGSYFPEFDKTGIVIPHQLINEEKKDISFPIYFDKNKFNLLHAGNLLAPRNPIPLVIAYEKFIKQYPEAAQESKLLLVGNNDLYISELTIYLERISSNLSVESYTNYQKVCQMQMASAVNIILEAKSEISPFLPGKFPHCVLADKPILLLGPNLSESRRLLGNDYKYWAEAGDVEKITALILDLYLEWKNNKARFKLNRPDLLEYLSSKHLKQVISSLRI
jgi:hypothetical protein